MNTPTGPRADEPIDGQVRNLLWRLRAHAVTPPAEQRVQADLDRLFSVARERAHDAPSDGASARPSVDAEAGSAAPDHPLPAPQAVPDTEVTSLAAARATRRWTPGRVVGRVAAAMIVVLVAGGATGARDGVIHLQAMLGRGEIPIAINAGDSALPVPTTAEDEDRLAGDGDLSDPPADTGSTSPTGQGSTEEPESEASNGSDEAADPAEVGTATDAGDPTRSETDAAGTGVATSDTRPSAGTSGRSSSEGSTAGSGTKGSTPSPSPSRPPSPTPTPSPAPAPPPKPDVIEPEPDEPILAAPEEPEDVLGAGGPRRCVNEPLTDCLPTEDEDTTGDPDPSAGDEPAAPKADELAERRFQTPSDEPSADPPAAVTPEA